MGLFDTIRRPRTPQAPQATGLVAPPTSAPGMMTGATKPGAPAGMTMPKPMGVPGGPTGTMTATGGITKLPMSAVSPIGPGMAPGAPGAVGGPNTGVVPGLGKPAAPLTPQVPGAQVSPITPGAGLRGTTILPGQGLNRSQYATQALRDFDASRERPQREAFQRIGQQAARFGRLGMGDVAREARDTGVQFEAERQRMANDLAWQLAEAEQGDARMNRQEARGERGYEDALEEQAYGRRVGQYQTEQDALNSAFLRNLQRYQTGASGNPAAYQLGAAESIGMQGNQSAAAMQELYRLLSARRAQGGAPAPQAGAGIPLPSGIIVG